MTPVSNTTSPDNTHPARQEKLLQGLMREIVRMTAQKQPLEVGVPLYPFSHAGVFDKSLRHNGSDSERAPPPAPLPHSSPYEDPIHSPTSVNGVHSPALSSAVRPTTSASRPDSSSRWGIADVSDPSYV